MNLEQFLSSGNLNRMKNEYDAEQLEIAAKKAELEEKRRKWQREREIKEDILAQRYIEEYLLPNAKFDGETIKFPEITFCKYGTISFLSKTGERIEISKGGVYRCLKKMFPQIKYDSVGQYFNDPDEYEWYHDTYTLNANEMKKSNSQVLSKGMDKKYR